MSKEVKFSLVFRDMWQSAGKYVPRVDQLIKVAPAIIKMGCFDRVETNGGGFEQVNLLFGENPNNAVRQWTKPFNEAGIQTHMLDRALNGLRMSPVPADVRKLFYKVKKKQGTDITRTFCGLNDTRNIIPSIGYAHDGGMISQCSLCITSSPIHTVEYYTKIAKELIDAGCDEICLKDMAGIGRPDFLGKLTANIKAIKDITIQYHSHAGPGFNMASILEVCKAGCDYVDVGMEPLSWGTGHADVIAVQAMLKDAGFKVKEINMEAYMEVRTLIQEMMNDFLGYYIPSRNRLMNSLLIGPGLPGGMMGSLMTDLETNLETINKWKEKNGKPTLTQDQLLIKLFDEVKYVWPMMGYPCLVTPFSQYVKNMALMNVMQMEKGKERWSMIADDIWDMLLGKSGKLPGTLAPELVAKAKEQGREFHNEDPQSNYPDALDTFREEMKKEGWDLGQDDEELFELAMHPQQYRAYKSGKAKAEFEADLAEKKAKKNTSGGEMSFPQTVTVDVNGEKYKVTIGANDSSAASNAPSAASAAPGEGNELASPLEGKFYLVKNSNEAAVKVGDTVKKGQVVCYVEAMKTFNAIASEWDGVVTEICLTSGSSVSEDDIIMKIK
ncbi:MAG TPA: oxaloacetate decarboxylase [Paludibacteraceae bacterium]|nr:oxaloacetate decarboxylase [Paludibacteraceae bacterium]HOU69524.1 oxaloacetate decarboxylase [Paludibacteraceae bacterium]HPH63724.1 oxaloacetate decarboxylase [Paludibacteraceae bacterium]HQJ90660.1 oxaloacetate decarboxylase [Paludibacteraceae bacterium]